MVSMLPGVALLAQNTNTTGYTETQDLNFADGLYQRGMYETAARHYRDFLLKYPASENRDAVLFRRGESLYQHASVLYSTRPVQAKALMLEARMLFEDYVSDYPNGEQVLDAMLRTGELHYKTDRYPDALAPLQRVVEQAEDDSLSEAALFYLARSQERVEQLDQAKANYRRVIEEHRTGEYAALASYLLAERLEREGDAAGAIRLLNDVWQNPDVWSVPEGSSLIGDAQLLAAQLLYDTQRFGEAAQVYRSYADRSRDETKIARAWYGAAWAEFKQGRYAEALAIAEPLQQQLLPRDLVSGILFLQGAASYQGERYDEAILYFRQVIADPEADEYRDQAWYQLAWSYYLVDQLEDAEVECRNLLQSGVEPALASNLRFLLGQTYARKDMYTEAIAELDRVETLDPESEFVEEALFLKADVQYRAEDFVAAGDTFEAFYDRFPHGARGEEALMWAANSRYAARAYEAAIRTTDRFLEEYPERVDQNEFLYRKGLAHYQLQQFDDALGTFDAILTSDRFPQRKADAQYWTAYIYELQELFEQAALTYGDLLERYPEFPNRMGVQLRKAFCEYRNESFDDAYAGFMTVLRSESRADLPAELGFWMIVHADEQGLHADALSIGKTLLELHTDEATQERALIAVGNQFVALQNWDEAQKTAATLMRRYPDSLFKPEMYWIRAKALQGQGESEIAIEWFEKSILELQALANPDPQLEANLYLDMGRVWEQQSEWQRALDSYLRVAILFDHPRFSPEAMYRAIRCHLERDEVIEASTLMDELLDTYPESEWAAQARNEFERVIEQKTAEAISAASATLQETHGTNGS